MDDYSTLLTKLGLSSLIQESVTNFEAVNNALNDVKHSVAAALQLKLKHVTTFEENFVKYQNETNRQLLKEEQDCVLETEELLRNVEELRREGTTLHTQVNEEVTDLQKWRAKAKEIKKNMETANQEGAKAAEKLARTKKSLSIAIGWYQVYLGIQINLGRERVVVTFGTFSESFQPSKHKLVLLRKNDGYMVEGGNKILSPREVMTILTQAREAFISPPQSITQRDSEGSTTASL